MHRRKKCVISGLTEAGNSSCEEVHYLPAYPEFPSQEPDPQRWRGPRGMGGWYLVPFPIIQMRQQEVGLVQSS